MFDSSLLLFCLVYSDLLVFGLLVFLLIVVGLFVLLRFKLGAICCLLRFVCLLWLDLWLVNFVGLFCIVFVLLF